MKKMMVLGVALLVIAMMFSGCVFESDNNDDNKVISGIDFNSYEGQNRAIAFRNLSGKRLIAFKGTARNDTIIGGINASGITGMKRNEAFFSGTEAFQVVILSEEQYLANKDNPQGVANPFTKLYVYFNSSGTNDNIYEISSVLGGSTYRLDILAPTTTGYNVELRLGGTAGEPLGFAQAGMLETRLFVQPDTDLYIFPVFHRYNSFRDIMETILPLTAAHPQTGVKNAVQYQVALTAQDPVYTINMRPVFELQDLTKPNLGVAYLVVINNVQDTQIRISKNSQPVRNSVGVSLFGSGQKIFQVDMPQMGAGNSITFGNVVEFSGYSIGPAGAEVNINVTNNPNTNGVVELENGYMYTITASGSQLQNNITASLNMATKTEIQWAGN